jgi:hypothetical protein
VIPFNVQGNGDDGELRWRRGSGNDAMALQNEREGIEMSYGTVSSPRLQWRLRCGRRRREAAELQTTTKGKRRHFSHRSAPVDSLDLVGEGVEAQLVAIVALSGRACYAGISSVTTRRAT